MTNSICLYQKGIKSEKYRISISDALMPYKYLHHFEFKKNGFTFISTSSFSKRYIPYAFVDSIARSDNFLFLELSPKIRLVFSTTSNNNEVQLFTIINKTLENIYTYLYREIYFLRDITFRDKLSDWMIKYFVKHASPISKFKIMEKLRPYKMQHHITYLDDYMEFEDGSGDRIAYDDIIYLNAERKNGCFKIFLKNGRVFLLCLKKDRHMVYLPEVNPGVIRRIYMFFNDIRLLTKWTLSY